MPERTKQIRVSEAALAWLMARKGLRLANGQPCSLADIVADLILLAEGKISRKKI